MDQIRFEGTPHIFTPAAASFERGGGSPKGPLNTKYTHDPADLAWKKLKAVPAVGALARISVVLL